MSGIEIATLLLAAGPLAVMPAEPMPASVYSHVSSGDPISPRYQRLAVLSSPDLLHAATSRSDSMRQSSLAVPAAAGIFDINAWSARNRSRRDPTTPAGAKSRLGLWIFDMGYSLVTSEADLVRLGGTMRTARRRPLSALDDGHWRHDNQLAASLRWQHGDRFSLTGGWSGAIGGGGRSMVHRIISLAAGTPIAERGFHLDAVTIVGGPGSHLTLGINSAAMTLLPRDVAILGAGARHDLRTSLSVGRRF